MPSVPKSEEDRAQAMLQTVADETRFGPFKAPFPFVLEVARRLGGQWGVNGKRGNASDPSGDILAYRFGDDQPQLYDVLGDAGGKNSLQFSALPYPQPSGAVWIDPTTLAAPSPAPPPPPGGTPPSGGGGGGTPPSGSGGYAVPGGLAPQAYVVADQIREQLIAEGTLAGKIPSGVDPEDGDPTLPDDVVANIIDVVAAIGGAAAGFALEVAATENKDTSVLDAIMENIFPTQGN